MQMQPNEPQLPDDPDDEGIVDSLEAHLNNLSPDQQKLLADALSQHAEVVIPVLGIVNGQEVYDYFIEIYEKYFNSAQGQGEQMPQQPNGPQMAPMSMPQNQQVLNVQPQAKDTSQPIM